MPTVPLMQVCMGCSIYTIFHTHGVSASGPTIPRLLVQQLSLCAKLDANITPGETVDSQYKVCSSSLYGDCRSTWL
ncbi:hypothetical protein BDQ94DRAFT_143665 [Aspergillus welwitschiae]|uniref:Uncharacterized protein n=1 Tax=Aspergillus welwitschiae TaxID=1341132 RepID=A0A3F3Q1N8_9EURO|nr:hypothetical protein BDQ94DRAFT_143665 [Aspergillus welwitschiae]RDH33144.1 hypothetical protein BDQ94DRAFT_143665 [Aspergillus welwitschiae]